MRQPLVGIGLWRRKLPTMIGAELLHTVAAAYVDAVGETGAIPITLPGALPASAAPDLVGRIDGLVLTGGDDMDPATYGAAPGGSHDEDPLADEWELALVEAARRQSVPLLAICRGMQVLNVACGGTLHQEVTAPGTIHPPPTGSPDEILTRRHPVELAPDGRLADWYGVGRLDVNTIHHQGVAGLGTGLKVEAVAPDGLIEAVAWDGDWLAVGVQWHPERMDEQRKPLFAGFADQLRPGRGAD